jgi:DNA-binding transcriptional MocR family regulator
MNRSNLMMEAETLQLRLDEIAQRGLSLNMARGKPCKEQLNLSSDLMSCLSDSDFKAQDGTDTRNYGLLEGLPEARALFGALLKVSPQQVIVAGNSSLNLMYDAVARALLTTVPGGVRPWSKDAVVKFLCPSPGYDRHFAVCRELGIEMVVVDMTPDGPDMDEVERLCAEDPSVKGIWCVPVYSNPDGITYTADVCRRLATMKTAPDFRIFWDNAYFLHHLYPDHKDAVPEILALCAEAGNPDRVYEFASTSKVTYAGGGVAALASSPANIEHIRRNMGMQTIGHDKINQLRHVRYLEDVSGVERHMEKHGDILRPKFETVLRILEAELGDLGIASWNSPRGGYFISLFVEKGMAKQVVAMAKSVGVELTPAGATYPYGKDPNDWNIRIAPSFPPASELAEAIEVLCVCVRLSAVRNRLA